MRILVYLQRTPDIHIAIHGRSFPVGIATYHEWNTRLEILEDLIVVDPDVEARFRSGGRGCHAINEFVHRVVGSGGELLVIACAGTSDPNCTVVDIEPVSLCQWSFLAVKHERLTRWVASRSCSSQ